MASVKARYDCMVWDRKLTSLLRQHLASVVMLSPLNALLLLHHLLASLRVLLLHALLGALLRPPRLLLHHAATAAQRTIKLSLDAIGPYRIKIVVSAFAQKKKNTPL